MAKRSLLDLANDLEKVSDELAQEVSALAIRVATAVVTDLAMMTPVDTSEAISNWIVSLGSPARRTIDPHFPGQFGSTFGPSSAETVSDAKAVLTAKIPGQAIYISNNLTYIEDLNEGSSRQAPAGFVERAELLGRKLAEQGL